MYPAQIGNGETMFAMDLFVVALLALAVFTGLRTMKRHHPFFESFVAKDLVTLKLDALLYLLLSASTSLCLVDVFLRLLWIYEKGGSCFGGRWALLCLGTHTIYAAISTLLHLLINRLLGNSDFCNLCSRR